MYSEQTGLVLLAFPAYLAVYFYQKWKRKNRRNIKKIERAGRDERFTIGFTIVLNIPFGKMLLASVSEDMVLGNNHSVVLGIFCCIAVVMIIQFFSWNCTGKIKKLSPIDAVRNGQTGERFRKGSILHLGKTRLHSTAFLAVNDVLSQPKQFAVITTIFAICTVFVMVLSVTANTLEGEGILDIFADNDMSAVVWMEEWYNLPVTAKGEKYSIFFMKCRDTDTADYTYTQGSPPMYKMR